MAFWSVWRPGLSFAAKGMGRISSELHTEHPFPPVLRVSSEDHCPSSSPLSLPGLHCGPWSLIWADVMRAGIGRVLPVPNSVKKHVVCPECHQPDPTEKLEILIYVF